MGFQGLEIKGIKVAIMRFIPFLNKGISNELASQ
jgi:hypothetical protein